MDWTVRTFWTMGKDALDTGELTGGVHSVHGVHKNAQCPASQEAALAAGYSQSLTDYAPGVATEV